MALGGSIQEVTKEADIADFITRARSPHDMRATKPKRSNTRTLGIIEVMPPSRRRLEYSSGQEEDEKDSQGQVHASWKMHGHMLSKNTNTDK